MRRGYALKFITSVISKLKRMYGLSVRIIHSVATSNYTTGKKTVSKEVWNIRLAILLPETIKQESVFASFLRAQFHQGSVVQIGDRKLIIDQNDLPNASEITGSNDWYAIIERQRYQIIEARHYPEGQAYFLTLRQLKGSNPDDIIELNVHDSIQTEDITQRGGGTIMQVNDSVNITEDITNA